MLGFIDDGQTITRYAKAQRLLHYGLRVTFRPTPTADQRVVEKRLRKLNDQGKWDEAVLEIYKEIANRIAEWEFVDEDNDNAVVEGAPAPTFESLMRMSPKLQDRLVAIVYNQDDGGDTDPTDSTAKTTSAERESDAQLGNSEGHSAS